MSIKRTLLGIIFTTIFCAISNATDVQKIDFEKETLDNGLRVIYAPMQNAPVVHVRVLYHVGSRDERPDRQGFAHMFEHMMFRGSAHIAPQEHMKRIGEVGGNSNAFTSYDQTTYVNTIPSQYTEMALYLEADRMASFKVSDEIFKTERNVVTEEWRLRTANPPYGTMPQVLARLAFKDHSYRWTTIGDMRQLRAASSSELQEFYNKYYLPNNACLIIAGEIDVPKTREWVHKYFGWIPKGPDVQRAIETEKPQTEERREVVNKNVPLPALLIGYHTADYRSNDHEALEMLAGILSGRPNFGEGRGGPGAAGAAVNSSRLNRLLVSADTPLCISVSTNDQKLEDPSLFTIRAQCLANSDPKNVEAIIDTALADIIKDGVTQDELDRVKSGARIALIRGRETCTQIATELGEEEVFGGDAERVNQKLAKLDAVTVAEVQNAAKTYLTPANSSVVLYWSDPNSAPVANKADGKSGGKSGGIEGNAVASSNAPVTPRVQNFPDNYPVHPPTADAGKPPSYSRGAEIAVNGVRVIAMSDHRLPLVSWSLIMRRGSDSEPRGKEGLGALTAQLVRRGSGKMSSRELDEDLESRGIQIDAADGSDNTRINGACTTDQLDHAIECTRLILREPTFAEGEFKKAKILALNSLKNALATPASVASRELAMALFGQYFVLGRQPTIESLDAITLDDVKNFYASVYEPTDATFVISGDIDAGRAKKIAEKVLEDWKPAEKTPWGKSSPVDYTTSSSNARGIILIDYPDGKQSAIRMAVRSYDVRDERHKYAGILATQILSSGIDSRLGKYVRAEKGYTYGVRGTFNPGRHGGEFDVTVDTNPDTTGPCIAACVKVLRDMASGAAPITPQELADAKMRAIGGMVMDTQTIQQQMTRRVDALLNGYPINYYDLLPAKLNEVTADEVKDVVEKFVKDDQMSIVVVGPGEIAKPQLELIGPVTVKPMTGLSK